MAKDIKVIKCPQCGSIDKTELRTDFFKCDSCGATYYLDNDDINVNVNYSHKPAEAAKPVFPAQKPKSLLVVLVIGVIGLLFLFFLIGKPARHKAESTKVSEPYQFYENYVYLNTKTQKPVLIRLGNEQLKSQNGNYDYVNIHAVFIDPATDQQLADRVLLTNIRRLDDDNYEFGVFGNGTILMIYNKSKIYNLDRVSNKLTEVTTTIFKNHPEMNSGLATAELRSDDMFNIRNNDGEWFYYVLAADRMFRKDDYDKFNEALHADGSRTLYFSRVNDQVMKVNGWVKDRMSYVNLTPDRKYFDLRVVYQDQANLLISNNVNAAENSPVLLQNLDTNTGKTIWTFPAEHYYLGSAVRYKDGYAVEYWSGDNMDYVSGVLMINNEGELQHNYLIKRGE